MESRNIDWSPAMEVGHAKIDQQHKKLFDLAAMLVKDDNHLRMMTILASLSEYVQVHFREEEALFAEIGFPEAEAHKQAHNAFRSRLAKLYANAGGMMIDRIADEVRLLVNDWLANHILVTDHEYIEYLNQSAKV